MTVETRPGPHPDMDREREDIHEVLSMDNRVLNALVPQVDTHRAAMGFFIAYRDDEVLIEGGADVRTIAHLQKPDQLVRQLVLVNHGVVQPLVQIETAGDGKGKIVSFFDRYARDGMVPIDQIRESDDDVQQHVEIVVPESQTEGSLDQDLLRDVMLATNQAVNRAITLQRHFERLRTEKRAIPRPDLSAAARAQADADAEAFVIIPKAATPTTIYEA